MSEEITLKAISAIAKQQQGLGKQAYVIFKEPVETVINSKSTDEDKIEHLLDDMLNFCFDDDFLQLFRILCKYYFPINPPVTAEYIYTCRDMWDKQYQSLHDTDKT